ncbi:cytochrome c [Faunimonas sp. B44]|uniref:cytochrome c n=1 Tax=Faunimonas sp. B44 TaxID=3461493 RepID=UPI004045163F
MRATRVLAALAAFIVVAGLGLAAFAWRSEIDAVDPPERSAFDPETIARGAQLAAVGNCIACHTVPGGQSFAGGLALPTPFGTIYSTNITPDPETGIGRWSEAAFRRSMREGVDREGRHLYPAFPYDHYTRVTDDDVGALYAYLMTRRPVTAEAPANDLPFPYNIRPLLAGWKLVYLDEGAFRPDPNRSEAWNRGAYLAEGLGHCGSCHTPRNRFGALEAERHWAGGEAEGWTAYPIDETSPAPVPWDPESLAFYLRNGWHAHHGVSRGPMAEVTGNLRALPDEDIEAIAIYTASVMGEPTPERLRQTEELLAEAAGGPGAMIPAADSQAAPAAPAARSGEAIYLAACSPCHDAGRSLPFGGLNLLLSTAVNAPSPQNIVNMVYFGLPAADGQASSVMPGYRGVISEDEMVALLEYLRERFTDRPPWENLGEIVRATMTGEYHVRVLPSDGIERAPENVGAED